MELSRQSGQRAGMRLTATEPRHNLPESLTALVGRDRDVAEIVQRLGVSRLLTLVGAGGIGKIRLALAAQAELVDRFPAGVWLVELAPVADPALIPRAIAAELVISERTVASHVYRLLGKLGFSSRAQAAVWAVTHGRSDGST